MKTETLTVNSATIISPETGAELKVNITITPISELSTFKINKMWKDLFKHNVKIKGYRKPKSNNMRIK